jgi:alpha-L-fucosidase
MAYIAASESLRTHALPRWFDDAKFGLFSHWTVSSVPAFATVGVDPFEIARTEGERAAFAKTSYAEWYQNAISIPDSPAAHYHQGVLGSPDYATFVDEFFDRAKLWNSASWGDLFRRSGARYCVAVTKHHDGALMWPSRTPNPVHGMRWQSERDLIGECAAAARSAGLRFGTYYSGGLDWTFQGLGTDSIMKLFSAIPQDDRYWTYVDAHWREIIARYKPDVMWHDIGHPRFTEGALQLIADFYNGNEDGVVNDRYDLMGVMSGSSHADFVTPEYGAGRRADGRKFEVCRGIGSSFGYVQFEDDTSYASVPELVRLLVDIVADGGNLLLNFGAMPDGYVPWAQQIRLLAIGQWLAVNGAAIYGSRPHEQSRLEADFGASVRVTTGSDGAAYAMVCGRPESARVQIDGLPSGEVRLLHNGARLARTGDRVTLPGRPDDTPVWVLRIG